MARHGKKYQDAAKLVDRERVYSPDEAVALAKQTSFVKFDPTIEAHLNLGVDPRHADQMVRGTVVLPNGTGKIVRVAVFAQGDKAQEALRAGADEVGSEDLVKKIEAGWLEFDVALATPDMMGQVGRLGKILGRRGLMPNPKSGTITFDLDRAIREVKAGRVEFKVDKGGLIHVAAGKGSFEADQLVANLATLVDAVNRARPAGAKGHYLQGLTIASTMGPGIKVDIPALLALAPRRNAVPAPSPATTCSGGRVRDPPPTTEETDRRRQPAPAEPRPTTGRDGRGLIRRTGPVAATSGDDAGDDGGHAEAGSRAPHRSVGERPCITEVRCRAAGSPGAGPQNQEVHMPTEAKRETVAELRDEIVPRADVHRQRVPRPQGERDRRDPARAAQE